MFTRNIKDTFTANLLNAVSGVLGEAKKCKDCGCAKCTCDDAEETKEGYMPTNDMPSEKDRKTAGKLGDLLKRERDAKEKKEPNGVKTEAADMPFEKPYKKVGERKDEYGNKVKNVAKHLAKKAMKANEEADYLEKDLKKRKDNNDKAIKDMKKMGSPMRNPHFGEEVEEIEEKRGLWDNIHAKRKRIKAGSGERMRKPGSEGAPSAADLKASQKEEVSLDAAFEQIDETAKVVAHLQKRYGDNIRKSHVRSAANDFGVDASKLAKAVRTKLGKNMLDEEQIDELSVKKLDQYRTRARQDIIDADDNDDNRMADKRAGGYLDASRKIHKKLAKEEIDPDLEAELKATRVTKKSIEDSKKNRGVKEEVEELDELSKATMGRYINKAKDSIDIVSYRQGHKEAHGSSAMGAEKKLTKRHKGISTAVSKLTKEEQDFIDSLNDADMEQIDEISREAVASYAVQAADDLPIQARKTGASKVKNRIKGINMAVSRLYDEEVELDEGEEKGGGYDGIPKGLQDRSFWGRSRGAMGRANARKERNLARARMDRAQRGEMNKEEVELDEARGRPKKAGARDFTIHPKTKEKLMHNNPADMARIERLQKNGILQKPKTEANQHVIRQLQRAKLSMRGGETVNFTHGDPTHVSGTHASKLLDKYAGMKPDEKEAFQKKIGHSHANLKSEL